MNEELLGNQDRSLFSQPWTCFCNEMDSFSRFSSSSFDFVLFSFRRVEKDENTRPESGATKRLIHTLKNYSQFLPPTGKNNSSTIQNYKTAKRLNNHSQ